MMFDRKKLPLDPVYNPDDDCLHFKVNLAHPNTKRTFQEYGFVFAPCQEPFTSYEGLYDIVMLRIAYGAYRPFYDCEAPEGFFITDEQRYEFRRKLLYFKTKLLIYEDRFLAKYGHDPYARELLNKEIGELHKGLVLP